MNEKIERFRIWMNCFRLTRLGWSPNLFGSRLSAHLCENLLLWWTFKKAFWLLTNVWECEEHLGLLRKELSNSSGRRPRRCWGQLVGQNHMVTKVQLHLLLPTCSWLASSSFAFLPASYHLCPFGHLQYSLVYIRVLTPHSYPWGGWIHARQQCAMKTHHCKGV